MSSSPRYSPTCTSTNTSSVSPIFVRRCFSPAEYNGIPRRSHSSYKTRNRLALRHHPMLNALVVVLQAQLLPRRDSNTFDLVTASLFRLVYVPQGLETVAGSSVRSVSALAFNASTTNFTSCDFERSATNNASAYPQ